MCALLLIENTIIVIFPIKQDNSPALSKPSISLIDSYPGDMWLILSGPAICGAGFCLVLQSRHKIK